MMYFILTFFLGAAIGSFINVLIDRSIAGEDWVRGRSHCDNCKRVLKWYDLIPLVSFAVYRGKSRCCNAPLSYRYPLVEIIVGLLFGWWLMVGFWFFQLVVAPLTTIQPLFWLVTGIVMIILALADLFYGVVMLQVVGFGSLVVVIYRLILLNYGAYQMADFIISLVVASIFFLFFWLLYKLTKGRGMADGDMYVAFYLGLLLGWPRGIVALGLSFIYGAVVGVMLILFKIKGHKDAVPFVPFMIAAILTTLMYGSQIIRFLS